MQPSMSTETAFDQFLLALAHNQIDQLFRDQIAPSTCQLLHKNPGGELRPYASGVWARLDGVHYLLTAGHVMEDWRDDHPLLVKVEGGYTSVVGKGLLSHYEQDARIDLGCIRLLDSLLPVLKDEYRFWDLDKLPGPMTMELYNCCLYGFDEKRTDPLTLEATATAHFAKPLSGKAFEHYRLNAEFHYLIETRGEGYDLQTGTFKKENITPHGMSGGGIWYVEYAREGATFFPKAFLIGILTEYRTGKYQGLIANRAKLFRDFIRSNPDAFLFPEGADGK